jgi:hypothetical protein
MSEATALTPDVIGISTEIGRGHPHYLDCVWQALQARLRPEQLRLATVFAASRGRSRLGWQGLAALYRWSARSRLSIRLYNSLRRSQPTSPLSLPTKVLGRDLRRLVAGFKGICLVEHQMVARMVSDVCRTWFVHADVAAPPECACPGPERIFVPLEHTAQHFIKCRCDSSRLVRTGLMIEPDLIPGAHDAFHRRLERLDSGQPLTIAFFTSGAYPQAHVRRIVLGAESVLRVGMKAIVFCGTNPEFARRMEHWARKWVASVFVVHRPTRAADTAAAVELLPSVDAFVAASHERTNWALGLGLPMIALFPMIGTHARQNYDFAFAQNVCYPLRTDDDAQNLGPTVSKLRAAGALAAMARCGFGRFEINGAGCIADTVVSALKG